MSRGGSAALTLAMLIVIPAGTAYALSLGCAASTAESRGTTAAAYAGGARITLVNDLGEPVCNVQMGPSSSGEWGDNWLGEGDVVQPGAERTFGVRADPQWDVRVFGCGESARVLSVAQRIVLSGADRISLRTMSASGGSSGGSSGSSALPTSH